MTDNEIRERRADRVTALVFAGAMFGFVLLAFGRLSPAILHYSTFDYWFECDAPAFADQIADRNHGHHFRTSHHPLWSIAIVSAVNGIRATTGFDIPGAIGLILALNASIWVMASFLALRWMGLRRLDAVVFTTLACASASAVFWLGTPETFAFGSLTIVLAAATIAAASGGRTPPVWVFLGVSVLTLAITTTNWMVALAVLFLALPWRRALMLATATVAIVWAGWEVQQSFFPHAGWPLNIFTFAETKYVFNRHAAGLLQQATAFFIHPVVFPDVREIYGFRLSVQNLLPGVGSPLGVAAALGWTALLAAGFWSAAGQWHSKMVQFLLAAMAGQFALSVLFGIEAFVYSAHWSPILIILVAITCLTPLRRIVVPVAAVLSLVVGINNIQAFDDAAARLRARYERERRFTTKVATSTGANALFVCGRHGSAGHGGDDESLDGFVDRPPADVGIPDPDACYHTFEGPGLTRMGWIIPAETWSMEAVEAFRARGATVFLTAVRPAFDGKPAFVEAMNARYRVIDSTTDWVIYDLTSPRVP